MSSAARPVSSTVSNSRAQQAASSRTGSASARRRTCSPTAPSRLSRLRTMSPPGTMTQAQLSAFFDTQLTQWQAYFTGIPSPVSNRTHCVYWPDWASAAKVELAHGMRMDANYYHFPQAWIGNKPGFMTGGGFPMRFADSDGTLIDVYQENT